MGLFLLNLLYINCRSFGFMAISRFCVQVIFERNGCYKDVFNNILKFGFVSQSKWTCKKISMIIHCCLLISCFYLYFESLENRM